MSYVMQGKIYGISIVNQYVESSMRLICKLLCCLVLLSSCVILVVSGSSSVGNGGGASIPTTFEWEGDKILNGEDAGDLTSGTSGESQDTKESAGMIMFNTMGTSNQSSSMMQNSANKTATKSSSSDGNLSGYASLGDIIRAGDWAALDTYQSSINATGDIPDSDFHLIGGRNYLWNKYVQSQEVSCSGC